MSPPISVARPARQTCSRLHSTISSGTTHAPRHVPIIRSVPQLRRWRKEARSRGLEVGLVPTMGALHEGHLSLVRTSLKRHPLTVMSLFVNPMQFAPNEDLNAYPRTMERDIELLKGLLPGGPRSPICGLGISENDGWRPTPRPLESHESPLVVFAPTVDAMYPLRGELQNMQQQKGAIVQLRGWGEVMEGASRPQFFTGVATVCTKLFNAVEPEHAYFGQKDIQQALILRTLQADLLSAHPLPGNVHVLRTARDPATGLALSSRNAYLSAAERDAAPTLHAALQAARNAWLSGAHGAAMVEAANRHVQDVKTAAAPGSPAADLRLDYVEVFDPDTFEPLRGHPAPGQKLVVAGALWVGRTRLIDNILLGWDADAPAAP